MKNSYFILTDSGGVQEEAISFKKPILIMRDVTERPEGVEIGAAKLVGNNKQIIIDSCKELLLDNTKYSAMCKEKNPYGDGRSSEEVVKILKNKYVNII
jgi:UDP-N-acetylglucosamine 2-epimerase (non-hydrolysing)